MCYLGDGVFWEVLVGEVTGLDQLAGDLGVWRVKGLPMGACDQRYEVQTTVLHTHTHTFLSVWAYVTCATLPVFFRWFWSSFVAPSWNVFGRAANNMLNSGVLSWNNEMSTDCAACKQMKYHYAHFHGRHSFYCLAKALRFFLSDVMLDCASTFLTSELLGSVVQVMMRETASLVSLEFTKSGASICNVSVSIYRRMATFT